MTTQTKLANALRAFNLSIDYAKKKVNPEEWATHIDWLTLQGEAARALAEHDAAPPNVQAATYAAALVEQPAQPITGATLHAWGDSLRAFETMQDSREWCEQHGGNAAGRMTRKAMRELIKTLHFVGDDMEAAPEVYGLPANVEEEPRICDGSQVGDELPLSHKYLMEKPALDMYTSPDIIMDILARARNQCGVNAKLFTSIAARDVTGVMVLTMDDGIAELWLTDSSHPAITAVANYTRVI